MSLNGQRYQGVYEKQNIYTIITAESLDLKMMSLDSKDRTLEGLDIIGVLGTIALENGADPEEMSARIWEVSRRKAGLADTLSLCFAKFASFIGENKQ